MSAVWMLLLVFILFIGVVAYALTCKRRVRAGFKCILGTFFFEADEREGLNRPRRLR